MEAETRGRSSIGASIVGWVITIVMLGRLSWLLALGFTVALALAWFVGSALRNRSDQ